MRVLALKLDNGLAYDIAAYRCMNTLETFTVRDGYATRGSRQQQRVRKATNRNASEVVPRRTMWSFSCTFKV